LRRPSIRRRLLAGIAAVQLIAGIVATLLVIRYERQRSYALLEAQIAEHEAMVKSVIEPPESPASTAIVHRELLTLPRRDFYILTDAQGNAVATSGALMPGKELFSSPAGFVNIAIDGHHYRVLIERGLRMFDEDPKEMAELSTLTLFYGARVGEVEEHVRHVAWTAAGTALAILLISLAAVTWVVRSELLPVTRLATRAAEIDATHWDWTVEDGRLEAHELLPLSLALNRLVERLQAAFVRERRFSADAAHEMKTAVAIVKSTLQLALEREGGVEAYRAGLEGALEDTARMQGLVKAMLQLARIEGIAGLQPDPLALADAVEECRQVVQTLAPILEKHRMRVNIDASPEAIPVLLSAKDLRLALTNLLQNAIQYSPDGSAIEVSAKIDGENCILSIRDEGYGIDAGVLPHIFERFYRGDPSRSRASGGAGLGLSVVQAIVKGGGGSVAVVSQLGAGSTFTLTLPLNRLRS
jgi:signal transduction histidine kinase